MYMYAYIIMHEIAARAWHHIILQFGQPAKPCADKSAKKLLCNLKFSRLKMFVDFTGQSVTTKISPVKFQAHNRCNAWQVARPRKFYP